MTIVPSVPLIFSPVFTPFLFFLEFDILLSFFVGVSFFVLSFPLDTGDAERVDDAFDIRDTSGGRGELEEDTGRGRLVASLRAGDWTLTVLINSGARSSFGTGEGGDWSESAISVCSMVGVV